jgi:UDP-glucuronate 4-epimerase
MLKHGVNKLIFASSSSVYGEKNGALSESANCDDPISPYAATKRAVELLNRDYHINSNFKVINLRLFSVYGQNQRPDLVLYKFMNQIIRNEPLEIYGDLEMTRDYTHVDDVVDAILLSLELLGNSKGSLYENINIGNSNPISLKTLILF